MSSRVNRIISSNSTHFFFFLAISAREHASTKKQAAQNTSLSLVRQLFHMGALEAAEPGQVQPKKKKVDEVKVSNKIWTLVGWFLPFSDAVLATDQLQVNLFPRHLENFVLFEFTTTSLW